MRTRRCLHRAFTDAMAHRQRTKLTQDPKKSPAQSCTNEACEDHAGRLVYPRHKQAIAPRGAMPGRDRQPRKIRDDGNGQGSVAVGLHFQFDLETFGNVFLDAQRQFQ